jgi:hypothetical protein
MYWAMERAVSSPGDPLWELPQLFPLMLPEFLQEIGLNPRQLTAGRAEECGLSSSASWSYLAFELSPRW